MEPAATHPPPPHQPAWDDALLEQNPHAVADKRGRVQRMFAAIAPSYDLNNRLHSFWQDQRWRRRAVKLAMLKPTDVVVDVACGTGDLTLQFAKRLGFLRAVDYHDWSSKVVRGEIPDEQLTRVQTPVGGKGMVLYPRSPHLLQQPNVLGVDFTFEMLPVAKSKSAIGNRQSAIPYINADAQSLPLPDTCCDVVSIAFGIRNVADPSAALREFRRVLRPGGRVIILEFSQPTNRVLRWLNDVYCCRIMPHTATWISGDRSGAYKYLPTSVRTFLDRGQMMQMMRDAGFEDVQQFPMTFGVCVCYRGFVRA